MMRRDDETYVKLLYLLFRKLSQYSPNDTSKAFDRQVTRRSNVKFNPKQTIEILKLGEPSSELDDEQKLDLVKKYMDVSTYSAFERRHEVIDCSNLFYFYSSKI